MKKLLIITSITLVAVLALGLTGFAFAQSQAPQAPATPVTPGAGQGQTGWANGTTRPGMGGRFGGMGAFGAQSAGGGYGLLHDEMLSTFAQAFNMTAEELQARLDAGDSMWTVAQEKGLSAEQFTQLAQQARSTALQQAVASGTLTQTQADWMQQHMNRNYPDGYGPGSANCDGSGVRQGGHGGRMQNFSQP
jgi:hypothetical protein